MKSIFGKGRYFIGDICYALDENVYHKIWGDKFQFEDGEYLVGKTKFAVAGTAYGDGSYKGTDGIDYWVDAGCIGIVPEILWDKGRTEEETGGAGFIAGGRIVDVKNKLSINADGGLFKIFIDGKQLTINTR
jgi:hypothetical protein